MITANRILQPSLAEQPVQDDRMYLGHQFRSDRDDCIWCGYTREDIEEFGERICPRREVPF